MVRWWYVGEREGRCASRKRGVYKGNEEGRAKRSLNGMTQFACQAESDLKVRQARQIGILLRRIARRSNLRTPPASPHLFEPSSNLATRTTALR